MSENVTKTLSTKQRKALESLLSGVKVKEAALAGGVTERTIHRWQNEAAFAAELRERSTLATRNAARRLTAGMDDMLDVLLAIALDEETPRHTRVRAALGWLDRQLKVTELAEVLARIERLERSIL